MSLPNRIFRTLAAPMGDRRWDLFLWGSGALALLGIPVVVAFPTTVPLVWLAVVSLPANSPLGPILPTTFEPLIMEAAKHERALSVSLVALGGYLYTEYLNWHAYAWILDRRVLFTFRQHRYVQRATGYFSRSPFWAVFTFALTPLPFWAARCLAILDGYDLRRFFLATALGRWPRFYLYAWLGAELRIPALFLVAVIVGGSLVVVIPRLMKGRPLLTDPVQEPSGPFWEEMRGRVQRETGFRPEMIRLEMGGLCIHCQDERSPRPT